VVVQFGDGLTGARLPTGTENVTARYRVGSGLAGLVEAGQINLLMSRPLGLTSAVNTMPSAGAADAEPLEQARQNAPLTVLTMDRIVSLQDCEDFARAFAGIGKAQATLLWNGERQMVHITLAGADGGAITSTSELYQNLGAAIDAARHANHEIQLDSYRPLPFNVEGKVQVDEHFVADDVIAGVKSALATAFSFGQREFAQPVTKSEVLGVMQGVTGVVAVDLDSLYLSGGPKGLPVALLANRARWNVDVVVPAELLIIDAGGAVVTEMS
jgi:predicted phage baseplate assembly protein